MPDECANPLLLQWLKEWMDQAQERNSKGYTVYKKAYLSMKACPLKFNHPSEAQQLNGLGPKLCDRLAENLKAHCTQNGLPMPEKGGKKDKRSESDATGADGEERPSKKPRKTQLYVPKQRSGPYALLMALATLDKDGTQALSKNDLIEKAQPFCDSSFTTPTDPTKFFTAWNSMKTLETKELVCTRGHPTKRYYLSDDGWEVALRIQSAEGTDNVPKSKSRQRNTPRTQDESTSENIAVNSTIAHKIPTLAFDVDDLLSDLEADRHENQSLTGHTQPHAKVIAQPRRPLTLTDCIVLPPDSFEVRLVLDTREIRTKSDRDYISDQLKKCDVVPLIRALPLGDVLWIASVKPQFVDQLRHSNIGDDEEGNTEIMLEHIMERKRLDDLIGSIKDGRFHEQKFRLRKSGIKNVTYLVEDYSISTERSEKYGEAVESVMAAMQVVNDIFVKQTTKIDDSIRYLARMTKILQDIYQQKEIYVIPSARLEADTYLSSVEGLRKASPNIVFGTTFSSFASICNKSDSMTLRDVYLRMLMCIRGVTGDKAIEIQKIWPTPRAFTEAFEGRDGVKAKENMVSDKLGNAIPRKKVGKALSAKIAETWA